ncbi:MAG: hypothetical protein WC712_02070 [Candidatus Brocadiia bacterium]
MVDEDSADLTTADVPVERLICPKCGSVYPPDFRFCPDDGTQLAPDIPLPRLCEICGVEYPDWVQFCPFDGGRIGKIPKSSQVNPPKDLDDVCRTGYDFSALGAFSEASALLHRHFLRYFVAFLFLAAVSALSASIPYIGFFSGIFIFALLSGGFFSMFLSASTGGNPHFGMLFSQLSGRYFVTFGTALLKWLVLLVPLLFAFLFGLMLLIRVIGLFSTSILDEFRKDLSGHGRSLEIGDWLLSGGWTPFLLILFISVIISWILLTYLAFAELLSADRVNNPVAAMIDSARLARKHYWKMMMLVGGIVALNLVAVIPCGVALLYTVPLSFAVLATVYVKAVGVKTIYE